MPGQTEGSDQLAWVFALWSAHSVAAMQMLTAAGESGAAEDLEQAVETLGEIVAERVGSECLTSVMYSVLDRWPE